MKYYVWKSKTPILDSCVIVFVICLFLLGFLEFSTTKIFEFWGVEPNVTFTGSNREILAICTVILFPVAFLVGAIVLMRHVASRFFGVTAGDSRVELDIEKRESSTYTDGKLESKEKWDKPKDKGVKF